MVASRALTLYRRIAQLWDPYHLRRWLDGYLGKPGLKSFAVHQAAIFLLTARRLRDDEITRRAAALTYYTTLSLVPLLAVGFALFKAFGGLRRLEEPLRRFVVENLAVVKSDEVAVWLDRFTQNINAGAIAGVGVLILFYSAVGLLTNVEKSFNRVWGIRRMRPLHLRFAIYWCIVTLAPPLLGVSLSVSARMRSSAAAAAVTEWLPFGLGRLLLAVVAELAVSAAFVLAYLIIPNAKVRLRCALLGGIVAGLLWTVTKTLFIGLTAGSAKYSAIYGALSALPLLILWLYVSWLIALFGLTYTYANQTIATRQLQDTPPLLSQQAREALASFALVDVARSFLQGISPPTAEELAERSGVAASTTREMTDLLVRHDLLRETRSGSEPAFLPARDVHQLTLKEVVLALRESDGEPLPKEARGREPKVAEILQNAANAGYDLLSSSVVADLATASPPPKR